MPSRNPTETGTTFRHPPYTYLHLSLLTLPSEPSIQITDIDDITALSYVTSALQQSFGLTGTAIPIDILKIEKQDFWIRVPYDDGNAVRAAVSSWSIPAKGLGLRVMGECMARWPGEAGKERAVEFGVVKFLKIREDSFGLFMEIRKRIKR